MGSAAGARRNGGTRQEVAARCWQARGTRTPPKTVPSPPMPPSCACPSFAHRLLIALSCSARSSTSRLRQGKKGHGKGHGRVGVLGVGHSRTQVNKATHQAPPPSRPACCITRTHLNATTAIPGPPQHLFFSTARIHSVRAFSRCRCSRSCARHAACCCLLVEESVCRWASQEVWRADRQASTHEPNAGRAGTGEAEETHMNASSSCRQARSACRHARSSSRHALLSAVSVAVSTACAASPTQLADMSPLVGGALLPLVGGKPPLPRCVGRSLVCC